MTSATAHRSVDASTGASNCHGSRTPRGSAPATRGDTWADEDTAESLRGEQETGDGLDHLSAFDPRPVACALDDLHARLAAQPLAVEAGELGGDVLVAGAPHHQRGRLDLAELSTRLRER